MPENLANLEYCGLVIMSADKMLTAAKNAGVAYTAHDDLAGIIKRKIIAAKTVHIAATIMYLVNCFCIFYFLITSLINKYIPAATESKDKITVIMGLVAK